MSKHHLYSRRQFRRRLVIWVRPNLKPVTGLTVGLVIVLAAITGIVLATEIRSTFQWWLVGVLQTGMVATYLHMLHTGFLAHDADAIRHVRGAWGEDNTRSELQRAKRKRPVCGTGR